MKWPLWLIWSFVAAYAAALLLLAIGTFGWLGQERDPLAAIFLLPLGLPWNLLADRAGISGPVAVIVAPLINIAIGYALWRRFR